MVEVSAFPALCFDHLKLSLLGQPGGAFSASPRQCNPGYLGLPCPSAQPQAPGLSQLICGCAQAGQGGRTEGLLAARLTTAVVPFRC